MAEPGRKSSKRFGKRIPRPECAERVIGGTGKGVGSEDEACGMRTDSGISA